MILTSWNILDLISEIGDDSLKIITETFSCVKSSEGNRKILILTLNDFLKKMLFSSPKKRSL